VAENFRSDVYEGGLASDPSVVGVPAAIGSILPRLGTTELWQKFGAGDTDWQLFTSGGSSFVGSAILAPIAIANAETVIASYTAPANSLVVGAVFELRGYAEQVGTTASQPTIRIRVGPVTLTGSIVASLTGLTNATLGDSWIDADFTVRSAGVGGSAVGQIVHGKSTQAPTNNTFAVAGAVDTTIANLVELTMISGNAGTTHTFQTGYVHRVL
jgi:hypothetical protein